MGALNDGHLDSDLGDGVGFPSDVDEDEDLRKAVRVLLEGMGEDADREGLRRTPLRVSKAQEDKRSDAWSNFMCLLKRGGPNMNGSGMVDNICEFWCPLSSTDPSCIEMLCPGLTTPVTSIIRLLGEDLMRKELLGTPARIFKWLMNFQNTNLQINLGNFDLRRVNPSRPRRAENGHREGICSEMNIPFCALCEHHLLPFHGVVHEGCIHAQGSNPLERSRLQSIVHFYGFKHQVQERITREIAELESSTATVAFLGRFSSDAALRVKFLQGIRKEANGL